MASSANLVKCTSCLTCLSERQQNYCSTCIQPYCYQCSRIEKNECKCKRCNVFSRFPPKSFELYWLQVADLQWFLAEQKINFDLSWEKSQLIGLIEERVINPEREKMKQKYRGVQTSTTKSVPNCAAQHAWRTNALAGDTAKSMPSSEVVYQRPAEWPDLSGSITAPQAAPVVGTSQASECKVCLDREVNAVFTECGHMAVCIQCAARLYNCPMCRKEITKAPIRVYLS